MKDVKPFDYWGETKLALMRQFGLRPADFHHISMREYRDLVQKMVEQHEETTKTLDRRAWVEQQAAKRAHEFKVPDKG